MLVDVAMEDESGRVSRWKLALLIGVPVAVLGAYLGYATYQRRKRRRGATRNEPTKPVHHVDASQSDQEQVAAPAPVQDPKPKVTKININKHIIHVLFIRVLLSKPERRRLEATSSSSRKTRRLP